MRPSWSNFTLAKDRRQNNIVHTEAARGVAGQGAPTTVRYKVRSKMLLGTVLLLFQAAFSFSTAFAATPTSTLAASNDAAPGRKVIMLVIDALPIEDFVAPEWTNLRKIAANGVIGLMNARTTAGLGAAPAAAHATIGAGARSSAGTLSGYAFNTDELHNGVPVSALYTAMTGNRATDSAVVFLGLPQLQTAAAAQSEGARPGTLGATIARHGHRSAVIGNADVPDATGSGVILRRHGTLIAMDEQGQIPLGDVGPRLLTYDEQWPHGWRTDYDAVWDVFTALYPSADFIVIEFGDFVRLDVLSDWIAPDRLPTLRRKAIHHIDEFIGRLAQWPPASEAALAIVSPSPPTAALRRNYLLTPVVWTRIGSASSGLGLAPSVGASTAPKPGLATSRTTRRAGIVTNTDIAPTVLAALDPAADQRSAGRTIGVARPGRLRNDLPPGTKTPTDSWEAVSLLYERATLTHSLRAPVVRTFISAAIAVFVAWILWTVYMNIVAATTVPRRALGVWHWLMLLLSATPLAMLMLPLIPVSTITASTLTLALLTVLLATSALLGGRAMRNKPPADRGGNGAVMDAFIGISLLTALALVLDVLAGSPLIKSSVLGYDPIVGARYYGIGNEYMGVLIGTTLVGSTGLLDRLSPRRGLILWALAVYIVVCVTLASPALGANVGGTIAAVVGLGLTAALLLGQRLTWRTFIVVGVALIGMLTAAAAFDLLFRQGQLSHLGQTVQLVRHHGLQPLFDIVTRKLRMNAKLLRWTIWARVFIVSLAVSALALYRPAAAVRHIERQHPLLLHGIRGAVIAAIVALIANDSGVVAAATMMIPVTATLLYLVLLQREEIPTRHSD